MKDIYRQIVIDVETTGFNKTGVIHLNHFIIEIAAVEIINRNITNNFFHSYIKPPRLIDKEAFQIHHISDKFLQDKPTFKIKQNEFLAFIRNSELIIHNANFDLNFLNKELTLANHSKVVLLEKKYKIIDSLVLAKKQFPGKINALQALAKRFKINIKNYKFHSALSDAFILSKIYLKLTAGQTSYLTSTYNYNNNYSDLKLFENQQNYSKFQDNHKLINVKITKEEQEYHNQLLNMIHDKYNKCLWKDLDIDN